VSGVKVAMQSQLLCTPTLQPPQHACVTLQARSLPG